MFKKYSKRFFFFFQGTNVLYTSSLNAVIHSKNFQFEQKKKILPNLSRKNVSGNFISFLYALMPTPRLIFGQRP